MPRRTPPALIDLTAHDPAQPVALPKRGPLELRYPKPGAWGGVAVWPRVSVGLAEIVLRQAGYTVTSETTS